MSYGFTFREDRYSTYLSFSLAFSSLFLGLDTSSCYMEALSCLRPFIADKHSFYAISLLLSSGILGKKHVLARRSSTLDMIVGVCSAVLSLNECVHSRYLSNLAISSPSVH
jgi:hypothetical protein